MAPSELDRMGPSGYFTLPASALRKDRTGHAPFAMELLALEGTLPLGKLEIPEGETRARTNAWVLDVLSALTMPRSVTSCWDPVIVESPLTNAFVCSSAAELGPPQFLVKL